MFSVILISYNRPNETYDAVVSILENDLNGLVKEIVVVNNASELCYDDFLDKANKLDITGFNYILSEKNLGVAGGRNLGVKNANSKLLFFLDDDAEIKNDIFCVAKQSFENEDVSVIAFKSFNYFTGDVNLNEFPHHNKKMLDEKSFYTSHYIGVAHFIRKNVFEDLGYYPEGFFYGMEEYDLSYRVIKHERKIFYSNEFKVYHKKSHSGRLPPIDVSYKLSLNKVTVAKKYLPAPFYLSHFFAWYLRFLIKSNFSYAFSLKLVRDMLKIKCEKSHLSYKQVWRIFKSGNNVFY